MDNEQHGDERLNLLSQDEMDQIILRLAGSRGDRGFNAEEAVIVLSWANNTRFMATMLTLVLTCKADVDVVDGEVSFRVREEVGK